MRNGKKDQQEYLDRATFLAGVPVCPYFPNHAMLEFSIRSVEKIKVVVDSQSLPTLAWNENKDDEVRKCFKNTRE